MFRAILVEKPEKDGPQTVSIKDLGDEDLPAGNVTIRVAYSTLNYKDGLAVTGKSPVLRKFPIVPGIDLAGTVESSESPEYNVGDAVVLNGWGIGETYWGGLSQKARVSSDWLVPLPAEGPIDARKAMVIGTAGYTAMLGVIALERAGVTPKSGSILVTGANGGVGSFSIAVLAALGYSVVASTGRPQESDYLTKIGASEILDRAELSAPGRPLGKERWAGAIDSVGSHTLANVAAGIRHGGAVAVCGLAQGMDFPGSVAPLILRGVSLLGIDSTMRPRDQRVEAWRRLAELSKPSWFTDIGEDPSKDIGLGGVVDVAGKLLEGKIRGRIVVDVNKH